MPFGALVAAAQQADRDGSLDTAACLWQEVRRRFPKSPAGFLSGGGVLKRLGQLSEAAAVLQQGLEGFPHDAWIAVEHAWAVHELGELSNARELWRAIRDLFPDNLYGYLGGALTSRRAEGFDEADDIYRAALSRFPESVALFTDFAWSAEERKDIPEAIRRWQMVRARFPDAALGYVRPGILLRDSGRFDEADVILKEAVQRFPDHAEAATSYAWSAQHQRNWPEALKRWELVVTNFQQLPEGRRGAAQVLMELGRYVEAANVLAPALRVFPDDEHVAVLNGWLATHRRDVAEAEKIWRDVHERFPTNIEACRGYALALREVGLADQAEAMILETSLRFPKNSLLACDFAQIPELKQDWPLAITRWQRTLFRFPDLADAYIGLGNSLLGAGDVTKAKAVLGAGLKRLPEDTGIAAAEAKAAERLRDWSTALHLWQTLQERIPGNPIGYIGLGRCLRDCGQLERSVDVFNDALRRFPDNLELEIQLALTLGTTGEGQKAVAIWEALRQRYPHGHLMATRAYQMMEEARRDQPALFEMPQPVTSDVAETTGDTNTLAALLKRFENLGDDCEFGLVQRIFHADALGLLRWGRTLPDNLVNALDARFAGVGDPENTIITINGNEYMTEDRRYSMLSHTFTPPSTVPIEEFSVEQCRRIRWLRQRLIDDLTSARKIFVYKTEVITDAELLAIYAALQHYSTDLTLLFVRLQESGHPAGTVGRVTGNLFVGYIDKFSTIDISLSIWVRLCQAVSSELSSGINAQKAAAQ